MTWKLRGRPKIQKVHTAFEKIHKRKTVKILNDGLDLAFHQGIITKNQYNLGIKLRNMHYTIFGFLKLRAYDPSRIKGRHTASYKKEDEISIIEKNYHSIMKQLSIKNYDKIIRKICIDAEYIKALRLAQLKLLDFNNINMNTYSEVELFKNAMIELEDIMKLQDSYKKTPIEAKNYEQIKTNNKESRSASQKN